DRRGLYSGAALMLRTHRACSVVLEALLPERQEGRAPSSAGQSSSLFAERPLLCPLRRKSNSGEAFFSQRRPSPGRGGRLDGCARHTRAVLTVSRCRRTAPADGSQIEKEESMAGKYTAAKLAAVARETAVKG